MKTTQNVLISRRRLLYVSGLCLLTTSSLSHGSQSEALVKMQGTARGERVWFQPNGIAVEPGARLSFINLDPGNSHTVTAYHPDFFGRVRRIPKKASAFHSGYMLPQEQFDLVLIVPGVYDYYCVPHELAAMVGRIVVGSPAMPGWDDSALYAGGVSEYIKDSLPSVEKILQMRNKL